MELLGIQNLWLFIVSSLVFIASPGIDTVLVLNKSISASKKNGIYSSFGVCTGILFHTIIGVLGLSLIIAQASYVFNIIKLIGAAYLIYLGILKLWKVRSSKTHFAQEENEESTKKSFWTGVITNIFNPKVAIFFLAFFPQFIDTNSGNVASGFLFLGVIYMVMTLIWFLLITTLISLFTPLLKSQKANKWINGVSGGLFLAMGVKLALMNNK